MTEFNASAWRAKLERHERAVMDLRMASAGIVGNLEVLLKSDGCIRCSDTTRDKLFRLIAGYNSAAERIARAWEDDKEVAC